jgi:hypothetical protein
MQMTRPVATIDDNQGDLEGQRPLDDLVLVHELMSAALVLLRAQACCTKALQRGD